MLGIMLGLCNVHRDIVDNCSLSWPIYSAIYTPNDKFFKISSSYFEISYY